MKDRGLPEGWRRSTLKKVGEYINGRAFKPRDWGDKGLPIIRIQNLNTPTSKFNYFAGKVDERHLVRSGNLLFAWSGTPGTSFGAHIWSGETSVLNQHIFRIDFDESLLDAKFFKFLLDHITNDFIRQAHGGAGLKHITKRKFEATEICFPPLPEQRRIVGKLDALFSRIDRAIALLEENIRQTEALMASVLDEVFRDGEAKWGVQPLGSFARIVAGGTPSRSEPLYWNGSIPWLSSGELNTHYVSETKEKITQEGLENSSAKIFPKGTLLCGMYDTAALKMSILEIDAACNQAIVGIKPNPHELSVEFLKFQLEYMRSAIMLKRRGVRQKNLNASMIREIEIAVPDSTVQKEIVALINKNREKSEVLQNQFKTHLDLIQNLKSSLLDSAFRGEL